jgi:hypothetical protein
MMMDAKQSLAWPMVHCRSEGTHSDAGVIQYLHHGYEVMQDGRLQMQKGDHLASHCCNIKWPLHGFEGWPGAMRPMRPNQCIIMPCVEYLSPCTCRVDFGTT